jgi:hypothetical protein
MARPRSGQTLADLQRQGADRHLASLIRQGYSQTEAEARIRQLFPRAGADTIAALSRRARQGLEAAGIANELTNPNRIPAGKVPSTTRERVPSGGYLYTTLVTLRDPETGEVFQRTVIVRSFSNITVGDVRSRARRGGRLIAMMGIRGSDSDTPSSAVIEDVEILYIERR